jgi:hypothetical protein
VGDQSEESASGHGSGVPLDDLRKGARGMSLEEFEDRHGSAFLVLSQSDLAVPEGPGATVVELPESAEAASEEPRAESPLAHPVRRTGRSVGHLISVGRTSNNDVVIADSSVSRFHAYLKEGADGCFQVQDAGSTNGTEVNGARVPVKGEGPPVSLKSGDHVVIGQVPLRYLEAESLQKMLVGPK